MAFPQLSSPPFTSPLVLLWFCAVVYRLPFDNPVVWHNYLDPFELALRRDGNHIPPSSPPHPRLGRDRSGGCTGFHKGFKNGRSFLLAAAPSCHPPRRAVPVPEHLADRRLGRSFAGLMATLLGVCISALCFCSHPSVLLLTLTEPLAPRLQRSNYWVAGLRPRRQCHLHVDGRCVRP